MNPVAAESAVVMIGHAWATALTVAAGACVVALLPGAGATRSRLERAVLAYVLGLMTLSTELYVAGRWGRIGWGWIAALHGPLAAVAVARWRGRRPSGDVRPREPWTRTQGALLAGILVHAAWVLFMNLTELRRTDDAFTCALGLARHAWDARTHTGYAMPFDYPKFPGLAIVWFMLARGGWSEWAVNLVYFNWWAALLLLVYAHLRELAGRGPALAAAFCIAVLPLGLNHAVMAGYADLPMAVMLAGAGIYAHRWARSASGSPHARAWAGAAAALTLGLPAIKLEGLAPYSLFMIWTLGATAAWRRGVAPGRLWAAWGGLVGLGAALPVGLAAAYGDAGPAWLPAELWHRLRPQNHLAEVWGPLWAHFGHAYGNWLIVGTLAGAAWPAAAVWRRRTADAPLAQLGLMLLGGFLYVFALGGAFEWLRIGTTVNRLYLQMCPLLIYGWAAMMAVPRAGGTEAPSPSAVAPLTRRRVR